MYLCDKRHLPNDIFSQFFHILGCQATKTTVRTAVDVDSLEHDILSRTDFAPYKNTAVATARIDLIIKIIEPA